MDTERGCALPIIQSVVTGLFCGLVMLAVSLWAGWPKAGFLAGIVAAVASVLWWTSSISLWRRSVYADLLPVEPIREPIRDPVKMRLEVMAGSQVQLVDLPVSHAQLVELAGALLSGASFSEASFVGSGKLFTRSELGALRSEMMSRGWLKWKREGAPSQGLELTGPGRAVFRELIRRSPPLPADLYYSEGLEP